MNAFDSISCTPGSWAFVVFILDCLPVYASVALRVATSLFVMSQPLVVPFTGFAARPERTWESHASLEAPRATRGQERIRGGGRAHPHPLGSNFRSRPKVLTLTVFAEDAEASSSYYAPGLGSLDFSVFLSLYFVRKLSGRPAVVNENECPK